MPTPTVYDFGTMTAEALIEARDALVAEAEGLLTRSSGPALTGDDAERYTTIEGDLDRCNRFLGLRQIVENYPNAVVSGTAEGPNVNSGLTRTSDPWRELQESTRSADIVSIARTCIEQAPEAPDHGRERATRLLDDLANTPGRDAQVAADYLAATSQPAYHSAWVKLVADPVRGMALLSEAERTAVAVTVNRASSLTDNAGGYAVPFTLDPTVILTNAGASNPIRQLARKVMTVTDQWAGVSSAGATASWDAEAAEVSDDAPTLAQPAIPVHKGAAFVPFSIEVGMDWANMAEEIRKILADSRDRLEAAAHVTGSGNGQPTGFVTALTGGSSLVTPTTAETFAIADVYKVANALPERHWANARWAANRAIGFSIRQFADGDDSSAFWADMNTGNPPSLLGKGFYEASEMDGTFDPAATANNYILALADWDNYVVVDRLGFTIELVPHLFHTASNRPSGQRGFYAYWRTGADSVNDDAFRLLNIATTA